MGGRSAPGSTGAEDLRRLLARPGSRGAPAIFHFPFAVGHSPVIAGEVPADR